MANWSGFVLTDVGAKLQAKINAGLTTLKFTKLGIGSGSGSGSVNALTAMVNKVQDINIGSVKANNNIVTINSTLTNKGLGSAYQMRELGLFAADPDVGEILFAYMTDNTPDTMPADGSATVVSQDITLNITFSNTGKVSATIDTGAFVTHEDLNIHNTSSSAHADIRAQITSDINAHNRSNSAHTPITDQIKAILGDTNWQENPVSNLKDIKNLLGQGAIVASKLDANAGFVKFANGFIIQWIENESVVAYDYKKYELTFPIAFGANCIGAWISIGNSVPVSGVEVFYFDKKSTTGITLIADSSHAQATVDRVVCLALGF